MSDQKVCPTCGTEYPLSERFCPRDGTALRSSNATGDLIGTVVADRYHILKKLGEGGMGTVFLAEHVKMGRKAALKVMNPGMNSDADAIARFNREAANASRLNHPNVCGIYDFGETSDGLIYLAMEFIEGESLTSLIEKNGALAAPRSASIIHQAADALAVAHDYGIVHRDLKPDNIMIAKSRDGSDLVKVVDFGIAKASSSDAQKVTKTGLVVGTPEYMSPEQLSGDKLDGRSDIYSLGLVAFNCLTGTLPFPSESAQETMIMRLTDRPKTLADMRPDLQWPTELQAVMDKALSRDVTQRYQNAAQFGREITKAVENMPHTLSAGAATQVMGAAGSQPTAAVGAAVPPTRVAASRGSETKKVDAVAVAPAAKKSSMGMMVGIGAAVIVLGGGGGFFLMNRGGASGAAPGAPPAGQQQKPSASRDTVSTAAAPAPAAVSQQPATKQPGVTQNALDTRTTGVAANAVPAAAPAGSQAPPAADPATELARIESILGDPKATKDQATGALPEINEIISKTSAPLKGYAYYVQMMSYAVLNDDRVCESVRNALSNGVAGNQKRSAERMKEAAC